MVLGLLVLTSIPTVVGVAEAISAQKQQNEQMKDRIKFNLSADSLGDQAFCVLADNQIFIDHPAAPVLGYRFNGYFFTYPSEEKHMGLVSLISDEPPMLNWLYADRDSGSVRYGGRADTLEQHIGPWGWCGDDEEFLTYKGCDVFLAVEQDEDTATSSDGSGGGDGKRSRRWSIHLHPKVIGLDGDMFKGRTGVQTRLRRHMALGVKSSFLKRDE
ncbi:uncharacterized protein MKZ38_002260 [Zalerion maritima]|uniref:Uncharacterized protein n=1 Tax=Zalerion maritima TaxID=339359 RepID=A0AAD5WMH9_9PEZI|nr:uncharacterized protein MKZ38_002260 [Zalerion maritima]